MNKIVFSGCSMSSGCGWRDVEDNIQYNCYDDPRLWVNLCHRNIPEFQNLELVNVSNRALSNADIFSATVDAIANHLSIEYLFCQWTAMPRYNFTVGFELYDASTRLQYPIKTNPRPFHKESGMDEKKI